MTPDPYALAACLARPVARGWIGVDAAMIAMLGAASRTAGDPAEVGRIQHHLFALRLEAEQRRIDEARARIRYRLRPMIAAHKPWPSLMAEAHDTNGEAGFPLTEEQVGDIVRREVWFSLPRAGVRRHG